MNEPAPNLVTCRCNNCDGYLEFEREHAGERVDCPHCGMETVLYVPNFPVGILAPRQEQPSPAPPVIGHHRKRANLQMLSLAAGCLILIGLILAAFDFSGPKTTFDKGFYAGYEQAGIDAGVERGPAFPGLAQLARRLQVATNDFEEFRSAYAQGYRTSQNVINKLARDAIEFQDRVEHPLGY